MQKIPHDSEGRIIWRLSWERKEVALWLDPTPFIGHMAFKRFEGQRASEVTRVVWTDVSGDRAGGEYRTPIRHFDELIPWMERGVVRGWWMPVRVGGYTYIRRATAAERGTISG